MSKPISSQAKPFGRLPVSGSRIGRTTVRKVLAARSFWVRRTKNWGVIVSELQEQTLHYLLGIDAEWQGSFRIPLIIEEIICASGEAFLALLGMLFPCPAKGRSKKNASSQ